MRLVWHFSIAARISNLIIQLMNTYTGRGPTKAWTSFDGDLISVVLRDTLTKGERRLVADGQSELVREMRKAFQRTMRNDAIAGVEQLTGRKVIAFLSDNHIEPDIAVATFILDSRPQDRDGDQAERDGDHAGRVEGDAAERVEAQPRPGSSTISKLNIRSGSIRV